MDAGSDVIKQMMAAERERERGQSTRHQRATEFVQLFMLTLLLAMEELARWRRLTTASALDGSSCCR